MASEIGNKGRAALKRVLFLFTGGTISMKIDPETGGAMPALSGREILAFDRGIGAFVEPEVVDFARWPGPHWTPERMWEASNRLRTELEREEIAGAVVTHGTDTLEETAYFVDLRHRGEKPVVFTGSLKNSSELGFDGPANLRAAARVAASGEARGLGVVVVLNRMIHAAAAVTKTDTQQMETFQSPNLGALGVVDEDRVIVAHRPAGRVQIEGERFEPRVDLVKMYAGADGRFIDFAREQGARGIVVEGTGRGNVPPAALPAVRRAVESGVAVVIATRCPGGRILDTYAYEGSGRDLRRMGCLFAGMLNGPKARIRLMLALGAARDGAELRRLVEGGAYC
jgi:L-asparaginase